jgi:hypothetical protein
MSFQAVVLGLVGSVVARAFVFLGIGFVTYASVVQQLNSFLAAARDGLSGLPPTAAALFALGGGNVVAGILLGALTGAVSLLAVKKLAFR